MEERGRERVRVAEEDAARRAREAVLVPALDPGDVGELVARPRCARDRGRAPCRGGRTPGSRRSRTPPPGRGRAWSSRSTRRRAGRSRLTIPGHGRSLRRSAAGPPRRRPIRVASRSVTGARRLSQAIAEGDGISVLVEVADGAGAGTAQEQGAEGLVVAPAHGRPPGEHPPAAARVRPPATRSETSTRSWSTSPSTGTRSATSSTRHTLVVSSASIRVSDEDELEEVLELVDPEILLLSAEEADDGQEHLERLLELLPDIPAGKLAIAELAGASRSDVARARAGRGRRGDRLRQRRGVARR